LNSPVSYAPSIPRFTRVKNALGCSLAIERLMETNDPFGWLASARFALPRAATKP
jgi:hypothetical protein